MPLTLSTLSANSLLEVVRDAGAAAPGRTPAANDGSAELDYYFASYSDYRIHEEMLKVVLEQKSGGCKPSADGRRL